MANKNINSAASTDVAASPEFLAVSQQRDNLQVIANVAAQNLLGIEAALAPFTSRKFNIFSAIFHLQELIRLIEQILQVVRDFKQKHINTPNPDATAA